MSKYINWQRVVTEKDVVNSECFLSDADTQALLHDRNCTIIKDGGYIVLDFGKELNGGIVIVTQSVSADNAKFRIVFGESVMESLADLGEKNSGNHHSLRDMIVDAVPMSTQRFGDTGFRFVRLGAVGADIAVRAVSAAPDIRELEYKGSFDCDDELLNTIWSTSAYTVQLNMNDYLWDGVKRDRIVWIGDMHPEISVIKNVFGNDFCVRKSLDLVKRETPDNEWMNGFPTYSFWWIIIHYDWYMHWGDIDYLREQKEYMLFLADKIFDLIDSDFSREKIINVFVDWSSRWQEGEIDGIVSIACIALKCLIEIFRELDESAYAGRCTEYHSKLQSMKVPDNITPNNRLCALSVLAERETEKTLATILGTTENEMSCFMGYYILNALSKTGDCDKALELIRSYWGGMLNMGATTFWEEFKPKWAENSARIDEIAAAGKNDIHGDFGEHCYKQFRLSLCHGWAGGPAAFLIEKIGGIEILAPGCKKLSVSPKLAGLNRADISFPTPYGIVRIKSRSINGEIKTEITAPKEIEIV